MKRGLVDSDVSAATLYQQATILLTLVVAAVFEGNLMAQQNCAAAVGCIHCHGSRRRLFGTTLVS